MDLNILFLGFALIDLTHTLHPDIPTWDGRCGFDSPMILDYHQCDSEYKFRVQILELKTSAGTHMDAPAHCIPGGLDISRLPLENLALPCVVIDISQKAHERYSLSVQDIEDFESRYGKIPKGSCVIVYTGWSRFWDDKDRYRNNLLFPSISIDAAKVLAARSIIGFGIDTLSPDREEDGFPVHTILLSRGIYIIENIAHADQLSPVGDYIVALPLKGEGLTEAPVRLIGLKRKK